MRDRVTDGIPADAGFPFQDLAAVIAAAAPDARHDSLRRGLTARWPTLPWRIAALEACAAERNRKVA
jgi:hypothetical protein